MKKIVITSLAAIIVATAAYATGENVIASKKYTDDTFQTKISTSLVDFSDGVADLPALVSYDSTDGLTGNKIGILDQETIWDDEGDLNVYATPGVYGAEMDNFVPTVRAVANGLQNIWDNMPSLLFWTNTETAAVNNYSTTFNGTTNNWPSADSGYMVTGLSLANGLALKQNKIPAGNVLLHDNDGDGVYDANDGDIQVPGLVAYDSTTGGLSGTKIGVVDYNFNEMFDDGWVYYVPEADRVVPTVGAIGREIKRVTIPKSGQWYVGGLTPYNTSAANVTYSWLNADVKGTGLVTKTATDGEVGERKIFESTDVANYHAAALSQNEKDIQDISIPTVGAMMAAIQNGSAALIPAGTAGNVVTYTGTAGVVGSNTVASAATYDQGALTNGSSIANVTLVETKQNKIAATTTNYTYDATNRPNADGSLVATTATAGTVAERPIVSAATYDSTTGALTNGSAIPNVTALDTRQKKKVCAGWPSDVAVADRSDANCWLWELPD